MSYTNPSYIGTTGTLVRLRRLPEEYSVLVSPLGRSAAIAIHSWRIASTGERSAARLAG